MARNRPPHPNELGILAEANQIRRGKRGESNEISVRTAAGRMPVRIWAREGVNLSGERGDIEEAVNAARQIGDDTLQRNAGQRPNPHTFTHGTSEQRSRWFMTGLESGQLVDCDTFQTDDL